tara:strand:- start:981 stop:1367 length:387 start_codon:yes stop_codon:yes gene_type:complete
MKTKTVIYYDGICLLCSWQINTLLKLDKKNILHFSPLQSQYAKANLDEEVILNLDTVIVKRNNEIFSKSKAAFVVLEELQSPLRFLFYLIPNFLADKVYDFVAKRRYSWFGKKEECIFPKNNSKFLID